MVHLFVGLGNPGERYINTYHNAGFLTLMRLEKEIVPSRVNQKRGLYRVVQGTINNIQTILLYPLTFMNNSGLAVSKFLKYKPIPLDSMIVVHDDIDLERYRVKFQFGGSSAGHKGVQSIIDCLNNSDFWRLKLGVGRSEENLKPSDYVLMPIRGERLKEFQEFTERASYLLKSVLIDGIKKTMNNFNRKKLLGGGR